MYLFIYFPTFCFVPYIPVPTGYWIGLTVEDRLEGGLWADGKAIGGATSDWPWAEFQGDGKCVHAVSSMKGWMWRREKCSLKTRYICQYTCIP